MLALSEGIKGPPASVETLKKVGPFLSLNILSTAVVLVPGKKEEKQKKKTEEKKHAFLSPDIFLPSHKLSRLLCG